MLLELIGVQCITDYQRFITDGLFRSILSSKYCKIL